MKLKSGDKRTYKYELDKERLDWLTDRTNRSLAQTQFLFQLVDGDFDKLKVLEEHLKNCFVAYCPGDTEEVNKVMNMERKSDWFKLNERKLKNDTKN